MSFTAFPDVVLEALARASLSGTELRVALWLARQSYGWRRERASAPARRISSELGIDRSNIRRALARMVKLGILEVRRGRGRMPSSYAFAALAGWPGEEAAPPPVVKLPGALAPPDRGLPDPLERGRADPPQQTGQIEHTHKRATGNTAAEIRYAVNAVYNTHGVKRRISLPGDETVRRLGRLASQHTTTPARIARAVLLGYVARNGHTDLKGEGFNPYRMWTLTSVSRPANADANVEAYLEARRLGWAPDQRWRQGAADSGPPRQRVDTVAPRAVVERPVVEAERTEPGEVASAIRASVEAARTKRGA